MNKENGALAAMLAQYAKTTTKSNETTFEVKNYFTTYLPTLDGSSPFQEVEVHSIKVEGKNRKFTCISHLNDEACPFCEVREELLSTGEKDDEELAKSYKARKMFVVRVIDRENESDGPKFWRFPINYKKDGILDKIMATMQLLKEDITNPTIGRDLIINVVRVKNPRGGTYPAVNSVQAFDKEPLNKDSELSAKWVNDAKTWKDVYSIKGYDYLKIVVMGKVPMWNKKLNKITMGMSTQTDSKAESSDVESKTDDSDDLPF